MGPFIFNSLLGLVTWLRRRPVVLLQIFMVEVVLPSLCVIFFCRTTLLFSVVQPLKPETRTEGSP